MIYAVFLPFIEISMKESRTITFHYYFRQVDPFYDVVLKGNKHKNTIEVFCMDSNE